MSALSFILGNTCEVLRKIHVNDSHVFRCIIRNVMETVLDSTIFTVVIGE